MENAPGGAIGVHIRAERPGDREAIRQVHLAAFPTPAEANLVDALRNTGIESISLVAAEHARIIAHILFTPVTIDGHTGVMGLAPMAVSPEWQRKGVGTRLVSAGLQACEKAGYDAVVVLGHPSYYPRFGFSPAIGFGIRYEYDVPEEVFMAKELRPGALEDVRGKVRYHEVFHAV